MQTSGVARSECMFFLFLGGGALSCKFMNHLGGGGKISGGENFGFLDLGIRKRERTNLPAEI